MEPQKNQTQQPQRSEMTKEEADKIRANIRLIIVAWIRKFYNGNPESAGAIGQEAELFDLRMTPRGLIAYMVPRTGVPAQPFVILVSKHEMHIKPKDAEEMIKQWQEITRSGALRQ